MHPLPLNSSVRFIFAHSIYCKWVWVFVFGESEDVFQHLEFVSNLYYLLVQAVETVDVTLEFPFDIFLWVNSSFFSIIKFFRASTILLVQNDEFIGISGLWMWILISYISFIRVSTLLAISNNGHIFAPSSPWMEKHRIENTLDGLD